PKRDRMLVAVVAVAGSARSRVPVQHSWHDRIHAYEHSLQQLGLARIDQPSSTTWTLVTTRPKPADSQAHHQRFLCARRGARGRALSAAPTLASIRDPSDPRRCGLDGTGICYPIPAELWREFKSEKLICDNASSGGASTHANRATRRARYRR